jgi:hypothetical protein
MNDNEDLEKILSQINEDNIQQDDIIPKTKSIVKSVKLPKTKTTYKPRTTNSKISKPNSKEPKNKSKKNKE